MEELLIITGPTGTGKSAVAMELCARLDGEIISADSMQIYRGCDIGTAKPTPEEQAQVRHHLIDICDPDQRYSAAQWAREARTAIAQIRARGKTPILCGGTGFYLRALLQPETLADAPPNPVLRAQLQHDLETHGALALWEQLRAVDAAAAARLHPHDYPRVMRAIEVAQWKSAPASTLNAAQDESTCSENSPSFSYRAFALAMPREQLYARLEARIEAMLRAGFLDELKHLRAAGYDAQTPALQGVGYRQMAPVLEDESQFPSAVELWKRDTRRYAKRQTTWFRHQLPVRWLEVSANSKARDIAGMIGVRLGLW